MAGYQNIFLLIVSVYKVSLLIILSCPTGGFPIMRHNELRDVTVNLLQEVCHDVCSEPHLQQLSGEVLNGRTSIRGDNARLDVSACGYWGCRLERAFSMPGHLTQTPLQIVLNHSRLHIGTMSRRNSGSMVREFEKLRDPHFLL